MQPSCRIGAAPPTCAVRRSALRSRSESSRSSTALDFTSGRQLPWRSRRGQPCAAQAASGEPCGMILEADTVVVDLHDSGHRSAFNRAFKDLGLECANWNSRVYSDIRRSGDGSAIGLVKAYFDVVGWPLVVPSSERKIFATQVVKAKDKALRAMLQEGAVQLRDGVTQLIDDALADEARIAVLCGTFSAQEDNVYSAISFGLGVQRARHIQSVTPWGEDDQEQQQSPMEDLAAEAADAQAKMKQQEAAALARSMKNVGVDNSIIASQRQLGGHLLLRAAKQLGVSPSVCAVLGATEMTLQAGRAAGMQAISIPTALSGRYKPPSAQFSYDGFGPGGGATWARISSHLKGSCA